MTDRFMGIGTTISLYFPFTNTELCNVKLHRNTKRPMAFLILNIHGSNKRKRLRKREDEF